MSAASIIPEGEGKPATVTFRMPEALLRRVDAAATGAGHNRSETLNYLIRWALAQYEADRNSQGTAQKPPPR